MLLSRGRVDAWVAAAAPPVPRIAAYFAALYALCATQDVAVDGWALTLLSKRRAGWAATCNGVGQSLGYALSYVGFVALHARGRVSVAALAPPLLLASVALPLAAARWTAGPRPLSSAF